MPAEVSQQEAARELLFRRSKESFGFFFEHMWVVQVPRKGAVHPKLRGFQARLAGLLEKQVDSLLLVALKARQIGFTTIVCAFAVWWCLFHPDSPWLLASRNEDAAKKNLARAAYGWRRLPQWFKDRCPECTSDTTERLAWANESRVESIPASAASGRSDSVFGVLFDEAAHMEAPAELFASLQPLCYGPFIVFSSANGMGGWFHERWLEAQAEGSEWTPFFCPWSEVAERDPAWYERTRRKYRGQEWLFYQEFPANDVEAFARSGRVAFDPGLIDGQDYTPPLVRYGWGVAEPNNFGPLDAGQENDLELWVWAYPRVERDEKGRTLRPPNYVVFCDPAEGLAHGDQTAIAVWDANQMELVATSVSYYPIEDLDLPLAWIGHWYHGALLMVERNNHGLVPITGLSRRLHYPRLYRMASMGEIPSGDRTPRYGWITSRVTKPKMVHDFLRALRDGLARLHDARWRVQASTYVADGKGGYGASEQNFDDLMTAVIGGWQGVQEVGQYPVVWIDDVEQPPTWQDILGLEDTQAKVTSASMHVGGRNRLRNAGHRSFTLWS